MYHTSCTAVYTVYCCRCRRTVSNSNRPTPTNTCARVCSHARLISSQLYRISAYTQRVDAFEMHHTISHTHTHSHSRWYTFSTACASMCVTYIRHDIIKFPLHTIQQCCTRLAPHRWHFLVRTKHAMYDH